MHKQLSGTAAVVFFSIYFLILLAVFVSIGVANGYLAARLNRSVPA